MHYEENDGLAFPDDEPYVAIRRDFSPSLFLLVMFHWRNESRTNPTFCGRVWSHFREKLARINHAESSARETTYVAAARESGERRGSIAIQI